jgi:hypothetical protein
MKYVLNQGDDRGEPKASDDRLLAHGGQSPLPLKKQLFRIVSVG